MAVPPNRLRTHEHSPAVRFLSAALMAAFVLFAVWLVVVIVWGIA